MGTSVESVLNWEEEQEEEEESFHARKISAKANHSITQTEAPNTP